MVKDNNGFSLVELLVAMAIAAIVSGSISYLLVSSMRMYGNEMANAAVQQELQTTINQVMDYTMESHILVIKHKTSVEGDVLNSIDYFALGTPNETEPAKLDAQVFWLEDDKIYMKKATIDNYADSSTDLNYIISELVEDAKKPINANKKPAYLLADYVTGFNVDGIINDSTVSDSSGSNVKVYDNPISAKITIEFSKSGGFKTQNKRVSDRADFRNKIKTPIYVESVKYVLKESVAP